MFGAKKEKKLLELFEEELIRNHRLLNGTFSRSEAESRLRKMTDVLCDLMRTSGDEKLNDRLKSIEESVSDLYITGRGQQ